MFTLGSTHIYTFLLRYQGRSFGKEIITSEYKKYIHIFTHTHIYIYTYIYIVLPYSGEEYYKHWNRHRNNKTGMSAGGSRKPIQIDEFKTAIGEMSSDELVKIRNEIKNSIRHLERSNSRLEKYIAKIEGQPKESSEVDSSDELGSIEDGDLQLYQESLRENLTVLNNYNERIEALDQENLYRSSHRGDRSTTTPNSTVPASNNGSEGIYL